jgi:hypothetical protein
MTNLDQLVAISIAVSVFGFIVLGLGLGRMIRDVAAIQRAIFLQLRRDKADLDRELAAIKALIEDRWAREGRMTEEHSGDMRRQLRDLEAKLQAMLATPLATPMPPAVRRDRQTFVEIALLCKRALGTPPFTCLHHNDLLQIARLCKRALERETEEEASHWPEKAMAHVGDDHTRRAFHANNYHAKAFCTWKAP